MDAIAYVIAYRRERAQVRARRLLPCPRVGYHLDKGGDSPVDQIFDRLGKLLQSILAGDSDERESVGSRSYGDPDLEAAMAELDEDLTKDQEERERIRSERERRERASANRAEPKRESGPPRQIVDDYRYLGVPLGAPIADVKAAYKKLLHKHHPDRHNDSPENQKKATDVSTRINAAYRRIETWLSTGKLPQD
jgi:hypothetical protein